jgi:hypothetical protein
MKSLLPLANRVIKAANILANTGSRTARRRVSAVATKLEAALRVAYGKGLAQRRDVKAAHTILLGISK